MSHFKIPHDEKHRFLDWGPEDEVVKAWCAEFEAKGIPYEIVGSEDYCTIYKHILFTDVDEARPTRCCLEKDD